MSDEEITFPRELVACQAAGHGKVTAMIGVFARHFEDGTLHTDINHLDPGTRRMIPGAAWCYPECSSGRASLLRMIEEAARETIRLESEQPPLPW